MLEPLHTKSKRKTAQFDQSPPWNCFFYRAIRTSLHPTRAFQALARGQVSNRIRAVASSHTPSVTSFHAIAIYLQTEKSKPPRQSIEEPQCRCEWEVLAPLALGTRTAPELFIAVLERLGSRYSRCQVQYEGRRDRPLQAKRSVPLAGFRR